MPIEVTCWSCAKKLRVPEQHAGKKAKCPKCSEVIRIPELAENLEDIEELLEAELDEPTKPERKECPICFEAIMPTALRCRYCKSPLAPDGEIAWADGKTLVLSRHAELPDRCIKTGDEATIRKEVKLSWLPPGKQVMMVLLVGALLAQIWAIKATVQVPLSAEFNRRRKKKIGLGLAALVLGFPVIIVPIVAGVDDAIGVPCVIIGIVMILAGLIVAVAASNLVAATKITDNYIWLKGAKPAYLDGLPKWHGVE